MNNEEILSALWEAYKDGTECNARDDQYDKNDAYIKLRFDEFIKDNHPDLLEPTKYKHFDMMCECDENTPYDKSKGCCCYD